MKKFTDGLTAGLMTDINNSSPPSKGGIINKEMEIVYLPDLQSCTIAFKMPYLNASPTLLST